MLNAVFGEEAVEAILRITLTGSGLQDELVWTTASNDVFSVKGCHKLLTDNNLMKPPCLLWKQLWSAPIHERLKLFLWRMPSNVLRTRVAINSKLGGLDTCCPMYEDSSEMTFHLFLEFPISILVAFASKWGIRVDQLLCSNIEDLVLLCPHSQNHNSSMLALIISCYCYMIWKLKNKFLFEGILDVALVVMELENLVEEYNLLTSLNMQDFSSSKIRFVW